MTKQTRSSGFTIVELLIVIVVIAILAAITIVAYNGIQNRANDTTAKETASQVRTKIEAYNTIRSQYPASSTSATQFAGILDDEKESTLDAGVADKISGNVGDVKREAPVHWEACTASGATAPTGGTLTYWQTGGNKTFALGNC